MPDAIFPEPEVIEPFKPPSDPEIEHSIIHFSVTVVGYPSWKVNIKIYPVDRDPTASYITPISPANQAYVSLS
jgi:hypothetical protein